MVISFPDNTLGSSFQRCDVSIGFTLKSTKTYTPSWARPSTTLDPSALTVYYRHCIHSYIPDNYWNCIRTYLYVIDYHIIYLIYKMTDIWPWIQNLAHRKYSIRSSFYIFLRFFCLFCFSLIPGQGTRNNHSKYSIKTTNEVIW